MNSLTIYNNSGFTLMEVLIAIISSSLLITGIYQIFHVHQNSYIYQDDSLKMRQSLRAGLYQIAKDIRSSGYHPKRGTYRGRTNSVGLVSNFDYDIFQDIASETNGANNSGPINYLADTTRIAFTTDKDGDGRIEDDNNDDDFDVGERGERIAYRLYNNKLQRFNSEAYAESSELTIAWETLVTDVEVLNFVFLDSSGMKLSDPEAGLNSIKSVEVTLVVRSGSKDHKRQSNYIYRNRQGDVICDYCSYSKYRYKIFHNRIKIRNSRSFS